MLAKAPMAVAVLLVLCSCATSSSPSVARRALPASPSPSAVGEPSSPANPSAWSAALVAYQTDLADDTPEDVAGDLWLYDVRRNESRRLTGDGQRNWDQEPRFRLPRTLTYVTQGESGYVVHQLDLDNGERRVLLEEPVFIWMGWNADGSMMAWASDQNLFVRRAADGSTRRWDLPPYPEVFGRGGHSADERRVSWSPAGDAILVTDTARCCHRQREETIFVYRFDGTLLASVRGTFARWAAEGGSVYFSDFEAARPSLRKLNVASGVSTRLPVEGAFRIAVSPDGRFIAYDTDGETPHVRLWDVLGETSRELGPGLAPLWLSDGALAVTLTRPCSNPDECVDVRWHGVGRSVVYSLDGGPAREIALPTTRDAVAA